MLFSDKKFLIFINGSSLQMFNGTLITHPFPPEAVLYGEIVNEKILKEDLEKYFNAQTLKGRAIIGLSHQFVFSEIIESKEKNQESVNEFYNYIPFKSHDIAKLLIERNKKTQLLAANIGISEFISELLTEYGIDTFAIVPVDIILQTNNITLLTAQQAKQIVNSSHISECNFLKGSASLGEDPEKKEISTENSEHVEEKRNLKKQYIILVSCLFILIGVVIFALMSFEIIPNPLPHSESKPTSAIPSSVVVRISPTPTNAIVSASEKEKLKIQVLNGSGVAGQAGKIKSVLESEGYTQIETGNADTITYSTVMTYKKGTSQAVVDALMKSLKSLYPQIESKESTSENFDISIMIGKQSSK